MKMYEYKGCGTCRKARAFLEANGIEVDLIPIRETPPSKKELKTMMASVDSSRKLFNTSGGDYKAMNLKDQLPGMSEGDMIDLLASNGNLIKRPFLIGDGVALVGFKEDQWSGLPGVS